MFVTVPFFFYKWIVIVYIIFFLFQTKLKIAHRINYYLGYMYIWEKNVYCMKPLQTVIYSENKFECHTVHSNNLLIYKG